jgi:ankyrin repeat protein
MIALRFLLYRKDNREAIILLLQHGADPFVQDALGLNCIHVACQQGNPYTLLYLLSKLPREFYDAIDNDGNTALMWAACKGHTDCINVMRQFVDSDLNNRNHASERAVDLAALRGNLQVMKVLFDLGANGDDAESLMRVVKLKHGPLAAQMFQELLNDCGRVGHIEQDRWFQKVLMYLKVHSFRISLLSKCLMVREIFKLPVTHCRI